VSKYRHHLPQLGRRPFLTDGGLETTLIFHRGIDLPHFAAFVLLRDEAGRRELADYYRPYLAAARAARAGFILDSATWRASADWGARLGYSKLEIARANQDAIDLLIDLRAEHETADFPIVVSGAIGPRGDGYEPGELMDVGEAEAYHAHQIEAFAGSHADMVGAFTMTNVAEAVGIARAAQRFALPVMISFTVETDGALPTGMPLHRAIEAVDEATDASPAYYMINCAHPTHFTSALDVAGPWIERLKGIRANASRRSHAELNEAPDLDAGDPDELGLEYRTLRRRFPNLTVLGGCCGTDHRHVSCISRAVAMAA